MNYQKIYDQLISQAANYKRVKGQNQYLEEHHILPRSMGGTNDSCNLVLLTAKEHYIAHHLLWRIHPLNRSMAVAFWLMSNCQGRKVSSITYSKLRREHSAMVRENGKALVINKIGIHALPKEALKLAGSRNTQAMKTANKGIYALSQETRKAIGDATVEHKLGVHGLDAETRKKNATAAGKASAAKTDPGKAELRRQKATAVSAQNAQKRWEQSLIDAGLPAYYRPSKTEAQQKKLKRFWGAICQRHPELEGRRLTSNSHCHACSSESRLRKKL